MKWLPYSTNLLELLNNNPVVCERAQNVPANRRSRSASKPPASV